MYKPAHPGEVLKEMYLEPLGLTVTIAAESLGITRKTLSELVNGRSGISTSMALRLATGAIILVSGNLPASDLHFC